MSKTTLVGQPSAAPGPPPIPNHALLYRIGEGSYGEVWLARDVLDTLRAVKIVHRSRFDNDRPYEREFAGLQKFEPISRRHESQLDILHVGRDDAFGCFYYVMELADDAGAVSEKVGEPVSENPAGVGTHSPTHSLTHSLYRPHTLRSELLRHGRLPPAECIRLGLALATALEHLHSHGLVHRDIKPSNIVFVEGQPKLADIGLVTDVDATRSFVGTEGYFPPEGPGQPAADLFSLGKVLYEISTGRDRKEFPSLPQNFADLPDSEKEELREFNAVVLKACQPRPSDRYATAAALRESLEILRAGKSVRRQQTLELQLAQAKTWGVWAGVAAGGLVLVLVFWQQRQSAEARGAGRQLLLNEVQMARQGARTNGWFDASWKKLRQVAHPGADDARTQAAACLSGLDAILVDAHTNSGAFSLAFSPDGQTLLCAGITDKSGRQPARLWHVAAGVSPAVEPGVPPGGKGVASSNAQDNLERTSGRQDAALYGRRDARRHDQPPPLPVTGDAVAAWKSDGASNGTPVLFLPGPTNRFVLVEAATSNLLQEFTLEGNPYQGNENHPVLALATNAHFAAASVTLADSSDSLSPAEAERAGVRGKASTPFTGRFAVWDTATGDALFHTNEPASALAFSPDGRALAVGDGEGRVRVFSVPDFAMLAEFTNARVRINCFAFTPDPIVPFRSDPLTNAWWLAVGDAGGTIRIWRTATGEELSKCRGSAVEVHALTFQTDGTTLISAGRVNIHLWDTATGSRLLSIGEQGRFDPQFVWGLALSPDGRHLAVGSQRLFGTRWDSVTVWELEPHRGIQMLRGLGSQVFRVWFSADQGHVAALANNWQLAVWELPSGRLIRIFEAPQGETADNAGLAFDRGGTTVAFCAGKEARLWNWRTGRVLRQRPLPWGYADQLCFDGAGKQLLLLRRESPMEGKRSTSWRLRDLLREAWRTPLQQQYDESWRVGNMALLQGGRYFAVWGVVTNESVKSIRLRLFESASGSERRVLAISGEDVPVAFDPTGCFVAFGVSAHNERGLHSVPDGQGVGSAPLSSAVAPGARIFAYPAPENLGCRVTFGRASNAPSLILGMDVRTAASIQPEFTADGQLLAWGTEEGGVFVAHLMNTRRWLKELGLDVLLEAER